MNQFEIGDLIQHKVNKRIRMYGTRDNERLKDPVLLEDN